MTFKTILKTVFIFSIFIGISSCIKKTENADNKNAIGIFNYDNEQQLTQYNKLNLDETHPNLLNPQISKSDHSLVMKSWTNLHQKIGTHLSENKFNWEVEDSAITVVQKIYFNPQGAIENYFFNVLNKKVSTEKKEEYANLISSFAKNNRIEFKKDSNFAQCGKTKYLNN
jgi:hypothetical protein